MSAYTRCPAKFLYAYKLHRRGRGLPTPALAYGSGWHVNLQTSYRHQMCSKSELIEDVRLALADKWQVSTDPSDYRTFDRCMIEYENYLKEYGLPWEEEAKTVGWPDSPLPEIGIEMQIPGARHPYAGKLDRPISLNGQYYIEDHKTASQFRSDYFKQWEMDNQMIGYAALAGIITGLPIAGVRINLHVIRKSDSQFERRIIPFSQPRIKDWCKQYDVWLGRIENDIQLYEKGDSAGFPHNFSGCSGKYGMCEYAGVCVMPPSLRMASLEQDFDVQEWNPLQADEEGLLDA